MGLGSPLRIPSCLFSKSFLLFTLLLRSQSLISGYTDTVCLASSRLVIVLGHQGFRGGGREVLRCAQWKRELGWAATEARGSGRPGSSSFSSERLRARGSQWALGGRHSGSEGAEEVWRGQDLELEPQYLC